MSNDWIRDLMDGYLTYLWLLYGRPKRIKVEMTNMACGNMQMRYAWDRLLTKASNLIHLMMSNFKDSRFFLLFF